jgi:hypothetical protein
LSAFVEEESFYQPASTSLKNHIISDELPNDLGEEHKQNKNEDVLDYREISVNQDRS